MRKQELIHLHGLLMELHGEMTPDVSIDLSEYEDHGIKPTSIHKSKGAHKDAVLTLSKSMATAVSDSESERIAVPAE